MCNIEKLIVSDTFNFIINGKLQIPDNIKQIKIDVGLAGDACNSALWLSETNDRFVIGIEPFSYHWEHIYLLGSPNNDDEFKHPNHKIIQLHNSSISQNKVKIGDITNRFCGIKSAIDNVDGIQKRIFYQTTRKDGASGASSLLKPNVNHPQGNQIENIFEVDTISLETIIDHLPMDKFEYIEHIKTDCEGYDFEVVKSIGKYLDKIVFISSEMLRRDLWENKPSDEDFISFMLKNNFSVTSERGGEITFVNNKLIHKINDDNLNNKTLGL